MTGLKKASGSTKNTGRYSGIYTEVFYDRKSGEIWTVDQVGFCFNSWTEYHDNNVINICNATRHYSMQEIADMIAEKLKDLDAEDTYWQMVERMTEEAGKKLMEEGYC